MTKSEIAALPDDQLLLLAAKSIGFTHGHYHENFGFGGIVGQGWNAADCPWNPLINDHQAFTLMIKLKFTVRCPGAEGIARVNGEWGVLLAHVNNDGDPKRATRRAIVLVAALLTQAVY